MIMFSNLKIKLTIYNSFIISIIVLIFIVVLNIAFNLEVESRIENVIKEVRTTLSTIDDLSHIEETLNLPNEIPILVVILDSNGKVVSKRSSFNIDESDISHLLISSTKLEDEIEYKDSSFFYSKAVISDYTTVSYLEITSLNELSGATLYLSFFGFLLITLALSGVTFYNTSKTLKPVQKMIIQQQEFVSNASHELKTPLSIISSAIEILENTQLDTDQMKWLAYINEEKNHLVLLAKNLLELSEQNEGQVNLLTKDIEVLEIIEKICNAFQGRFEQKNIQLKLEVESMLFIKYDEASLNQILYILFDNAIKYVNTNGEIVIYGKKHMTKTIIGIQNTGEGIKKDDINRVFDRFFTGDKSRNNNSFGLGLSLARTIAKNNHSKIEVKSIVNQWTTFTLTK